MTILHLTLKKKWFDLIEAGKKTVEYREYKDYWITRLMDVNCNPRADIEEIHFRNGYSKNSPIIRVGFSEIKVIHSQNHEQQNNEPMVFISFAYWTRVKLLFVNIKPILKGLRDDTP